MISPKKINKKKAPEANHRALGMEGVVWGERYTDYNYKHKHTGKVRLTLCGGGWGVRSSIDQAGTAVKTAGLCVALPTD